MILLLLLACDKIILRRTKAAPFKIGEGTYELNLYELEYPKELIEKEKFLQKLNLVLRDFVREARKVMILLNEDFIRDLKHIEENGVLPEEMFIRRPATLLTEEERATLLNALEISGNFGPQQLLNMQVKYIMSLLGREDFDPSRNYSELQKDELLRKIFNDRNQIIAMFEKTLVRLFVRIDSVYATEKREEFEYRKHYFIKDIKTARKSLFGNKFESYKNMATIFIQDMKTKHLERLVNSEVRINLDNYVVENDRFKGYIVRSSNIYLTGGHKAINDFRDINIFIKVVPTELSELSAKGSKYLLEDLFKTKDKIEKEDKMLGKSVEMIRERYDEKKIKEAEEKKIKEAEEKKGEEELEA